MRPPIDSLEIQGEKGDGEEGGGEEGGEGERGRRGKNDSKKILLKSKCHLTVIEDATNDE